MSDKKSKAKKIIISILIVALIATAVCIFLVTKNKKNNKTENNSVTPISQTSSIESEINSDVINQKVCQEYNGNYIFYGVADISFEESLSRYDEYKIYQSIAGSNTTDKNSFIHYLNKQNNYDNTNKIITLVNGKYTLSIGQTKAESGLFFGNLNKSIIFIKDPKGTTIIDEKNYSQAFEISQTGYWLSNKITEKNSDLDIIYIREKFYYGNNVKKFFYVTYAYQMI